MGFRGGGGLTGPQGDSVGSHTLTRRLKAPGAGVRCLSSLPGVGRNTALSHRQANCLKRVVEGHKHRLAGFQLSCRHASERRGHTAQPYILQHSSHWPHVALGVRADSTEVGSAAPRALAVWVLPGHLWPCAAGRPMLTEPVLTSDRTVCGMPACGHSSRT